jgi:hypothetical protein
MSGKRQNIQYSLASGPKGRGETPVIGPLSRDNQDGITIQIVALQTAIRPNSVENVDARRP